VNAVAAGPAAPRYEPLGQAVDVPWRVTAPGYATVGGPMLEVHVVPVGGDPLPARVVASLRDRLTERLRVLGAVPVTAGLDVVPDAGG